MDWSLPPQGKRAEFNIGINLGAEYGPAKRWPIEKFAEAANQLYKRISCEFLIFGGKGDVALAEQLCDLLRRPRPIIMLWSWRENFVERPDGWLDALPCFVDQRHRADACGGGVGDAGGGAVGSTSPELTGPGCRGMGGTS